MSIVAEFLIEADEFRLGRAITDVPGLSVEVERVVPGGNRTMPYLWVHGQAFDEFEEVLADHPNVRSLTALDRLDDSALYKVQWEDRTKQLISEIANGNATILEAYGDDEWLFRIRFEDHDDLTAFNDYCTDNGIDYQLERVYSMADVPGSDPASNLTEPQREVLVMAVERGYFEVPRRVTLAELAADLGVSEQAISERVRRGTDTVLREALRLDRREPAPG